ncbi:hypothetical protein SFR_2887 [Streptomyces sp. FR-008]|nr:hypothetical protein SFR_2887 [Streptomyces sp. FR-008]
MCLVPDWPQTPAGLGVAAPRLGVPVVARARSLTGLKRRPGCDWAGGGWAPPPPARHDPAGH